MRPVVDWWNMLRPILVIGLGIERWVHHTGGRNARRSMWGA
jgi:hypothetical protein